MQRVVSSFISCAPYTSALQRTFYEAIYSPQYALILYAVFVKGSVYCDAFDPHPDPQREMPVRKQRNKERQTELHTQQKAPKRAGNGSPSALDTLRNQQVVCSSHITSSKTPRNRMISGCFCAFSELFGGGLFSLTHIVTHTVKWLERSGEHQTGFYMTCAMNSPIFSAASSWACRVAWVYVRRVNPTS